MEEFKKAKRYYKWVAEYKNGETHFQDETKFKEIFEANEKGEVTKFALFPLEQGFKEIVLTLGEKRRLIYFERTIGNTGNEFEPFLIYLLGWQETNQYVNTKVIMYIYPNGNMEVNNGETTLLDDYLEKIKQNGR
jgi:hypothetical protein